jgi:hypothetical protein
MTTPSTNLGLSNIQTEFGGSNPISLSEYYRGGANVPSGTATSPVDGTPIPTSGTIRMGEFRDVSKSTTINLTLSANTTNYNIFTAASSPSGPAAVTLTINSGVLVGTNFIGNNTTPVLDTGTGWAAGSTISIINNGSIIGSAGYAPSAGSAGANQPGGAGGDGGPAINAQYPISITNNGIIAGGGGGGGGGGQTGSGNASGNGTGAGTQFGPALQAAQGASGASNAGGTPGAAGSGPEVAGGNATNATGTLNGQGGGGGGYGAPGGKGGNTVTPAEAGGYGGSGGAFVVGSSNVTWVSFGNRYGSFDTGNYTLLSTNGSNITSSSSLPSGNAGAASVTLTFTPAGTFTATADSTSSNAKGRWSNKATTATTPGASTWIKATLQSGTTPTGSSIGSWLPLTSNVSWTWTSPTGSAGTSTGTILVQFSTSSSGTPVVSNQTYVATATHG